MESIDNFLTVEVKKEIAERYFGFRRAIEEDTSSYLKKVLDCSHELEENIGHNLVRIYTLLNSQVLIKRFIKLAALPERFFVDSYINTLPKKQTLFTQQNFRGLTRKGCLNNMFFDTCNTLFHHIEEYRKKYELLREDQETIVAQIEIFYQKNDIDTIFFFLRNLDGNLSTAHNTSFNQAANGSMSDKLRIYPPPPVTELLPELSAMPTVKEMKKELRELVTTACQNQPLLDLRNLKKEVK